MAKSSLAAITIMAISIIMVGSSMTSADAAKYTGDPEIDPECAITPGGFCNMSFSDLCGVESVSAKVSFINTLTIWDGASEKYELLTEADGTIYDDAAGGPLGDPIGYIEDSVTEKGHLNGKGSTVQKQIISVECINGEKDTIEKNVTVKHPNK
jgi:hypothetical protein